MKPLGALLASVALVTILFCCGCSGDTAKPAAQPSVQTPAASQQPTPPPAIVSNTPAPAAQGATSQVPATTTSPGVPAPAAPEVTVSDMLAEIANLKSARPQAQTRNELIAKYQENQNRILELSEKIVASNPDPAQRDEAREGALQAIGVLSQIDPRRRDLLARIDKLAEATLADAPEGHTAASAHFFGVSVHLNIERDGSENDPSINKRLFAMAKEFAEKFPTDARVGMIMYQIGENAQMDGQIDTARETLQFVVDHDAASQYGQMASAKLKLLDAIGKPPEIAGPTLDGSEIDISSLKGKVVLVDFWATWCGPCIAELPNVKAVYEKYHDQGFEVLAVSFDQTKDALAEYVDQNKLPWPQIFFDEEGKRFWQNPLGQKYGINAIPATFLVDREGNLQKIGVRGPMLEPAVVELLKAPKPVLAN